MKTFIFAGYETTSSKFSSWPTYFWRDSHAVSLTWALIELAQNSNVQSKLRQELVALGGDPTYDQLTNGLPYLDAVVHETLRFHPPVTDSIHVVRCASKCLKLRYHRICCRQRRTTLSPSRNLCTLGLVV